MAHRFPATTPFVQVQSSRKVEGPDCNADVNRCRGIHLPPFRSDDLMYTAVVGETQIKIPDNQF